MRITKDPALRKQEIVDAAVTLFLEQGYDKTSVEDIVQKVQVAKGLFYYYFPKKEAILEEVGQNLAKTLEDSFPTKAIEEAGTLLAALLLVVNFYLACLSRYENLLVSKTGGSRLSQVLTQKLQTLAIGQILPLFDRFPQKHPSPHPKASVKLLIYGLSHLYLEGNREAKTIQELIIYHLHLDQ